MKRHRTTRQKDKKLAKERKIWNRSYVPITVQKDVQSINNATLELEDSLYELDELKDLTRRFSQHLQDSAKVGKQITQKLMDIAATQFKRSTPSVPMMEEELMLSMTMSQMELNGQLEKLSIKVDALLTDPVGNIVSQLRNTLSVLHEEHFRVLSNLCDSFQKGFPKGAPNVEQEEKLIENTLQCRLFSSAVHHQLVQTKRKLFFDMLSQFLSLLVWVKMTSGKMEKLVKAEKSKGCWDTNIDLLLGEIETFPETTLVNEGANGALDDWLQNQEEPLNLRSNTKRAASDGQNTIAARRTPPPHRSSSAGPRSPRGRTKRPSSPGGGSTKRSGTHRVRRSKMANTKAFLRKSTHTLRTSKDPNAKNIISREPSEVHAAAVRGGQHGTAMAAPRPSGADAASPPSPTTSTTNKEAREQTRRAKLPMKAKERSELANRINSSSVMHDSPETTIVETTNTTTTTTTTKTTTMTPTTSCKAEEGEASLSNPMDKASQLGVVEPLNHSPQEKKQMTDLRLRVDNAMIAALKNGEEQRTRVMRGVSLAHVHLTKALQQNADMNTSSSFSPIAVNLVGGAPIVSMRNSSIRERTSKRATCKFDCSPAALYRAAAEAHHQFVASPADDGDHPPHGPEAPILSNRRKTPPPVPSKSSKPNLSKRHPIDDDGDGERRRRTTTTCEHDEQEEYAPSITSPTLKEYPNEDKESDGISPRDAIESMRTRKSIDAPATMTLPLREAGDMDKEIQFRKRGMSLLLENATPHTAKIIKDILKNQGEQATTGHDAPPVTSGASSKFTLRRPPPDPPAHDEAPAKMLMKRKAHHKRRALILDAEAMQTALSEDEEAHDEEDGSPIDDEYEDDGVAAHLEEQSSKVAAVAMANHQDGGPFIQKVEPAYVSRAGTLVTISGGNIHQHCTVDVGEITCAKEWWGAGKIGVVIPQLPMGFYSVRLSNPDGKSTLLKECILYHPESTERIHVPTRLETRVGNEEEVLESVKSRLEYRNSPVAMESMMEPMVKGRLESDMEVGHDHEQRTTTTTVAMEDAHVSREHTTTTTTTTNDDDDDEEEYISINSLDLELFVELGAFGKSRPRLSAIRANREEPPSNSPQGTILYEGFMDARTWIGAPLEALIPYDAEHSSSEKLIGVPALVFDATSYILNHGAAVPALFNWSSNRAGAGMESMFNMISSSETFMQAFEYTKKPRAVALLLKRFLEQVPPSGVMPSGECAQRFLASQSIDDRQLWMEYMQSFLCGNSLPEENRALLRHIIMFLNEVSTKVLHFNTSARKLAIQFGPYLTTDVDPYMVAVTRKVIESARELYEVWDVSTPSYMVRARYAFMASSPDEVSISKGQNAWLFGMWDENWVYVQVKGKVGLVPLRYLVP